MIKIILPAYNEEKALPCLFNSFMDIAENRLTDFQIILINDGSSDRTGEVASGYLEKLPLLIIEHEKNKGLGGALKTGFEAALKRHNSEDIIVVLDADNTHSPGMINDMAHKVKEGYDIVVASRYIEGGRQVGLNFFRRSASRMANLLLKAFFPISGVNDYTCGFRAYKSLIVKSGFDKYGGNFIEEKGFVCMAEVLIKLSAIGAKVVEAPLVLRYDLKTDKSKIKILKTIARYCVLIGIKRSLAKKARSK